MREVKLDVEINIINSPPRPDNTEFGELHIDNDKLVLDVIVGENDIIS